MNAVFDTAGGEDLQSLQVAVIKISERGTSQKPALVVAFRGSEPFVQVHAPRSSRRAPAQNSLVVWRSVCLRISKGWQGPTY